MKKIFKKVAKKIAAITLGATLVLAPMSCSMPTDPIEDPTEQVDDNEEEQEEEQEEDQEEENDQDQDQDQDQEDDEQEEEEEPNNPQPVTQTKTIGLAVGSGDVGPEDSADVYTGTIILTDGSRESIKKVVIHAKKLEENTTYTSSIADAAAGDYMVLISGVIPDGVSFDFDNVLMDFNTTTSISDVNIDISVPSRTVGGVVMPVTEFMGSNAKAVVQIAAHGETPNVTSNPTGTKMKVGSEFVTIR